MVFGLIGYITSIATYKSKNAEEIIDGEPKVLYENNHFNYKNLEDSKLSVSKLLEQCRLKGCFDIKELECAILETSGDISILLKKNNINKNK